jgi:hypothetical protein
MAGVKGAGGPPPKRESQRRRVNKPEVPIESAYAGEPPVVPPADPSWHPIAAMMWEALPKSGQSAFYTSTDWAAAFALCESMSREFKPQPMVVGSGKDAQVEMVSLPPKAASLSAWAKIMSGLLVTEGDRRRVRLELERPSSGEEAVDVSELDEYRRRLRGDSAS